jgi:O-antigen ligase
MIYKLQNKIILKISTKNGIYLLICLLGLMTQYIYFPIVSLFGLNKYGLVESKFYISFLLIVLTFNIIIYFNVIIKKGLLKSELFLFIFIGFYILIYITRIILNLGNSEDSFLFFFQFLCLGVPGIISAAIVFKLNLIKELICISDLMAVVLATTYFFSILVPYLNGTFISNLGGASYQFLSYSAIFTLGLLIYNNYLGEKNIRWKFFQSNTYSIINIFLILICIFTALLAGGRGAFLLLLIYLLLILIFKWNHSKIYYLLYIFFISVFTLLIYFISNFYNDSKLFQGLERASNFLSIFSGGDYRDSLSGRDYVYREMIYAVNNSPLFGYGPFEVESLLFRPHNIYLELILQFGIIVGSLFFILIVYIFLRALKSKNIDINWIFWIGLFPMTMLMFSGSYMLHSVFMFFITYAVMSCATNRVTLN